MKKYAPSLIVCALLLVGAGCVSQAPTTPPTTPVSQVPTAPPPTPSPRPVPAPAPTPAPAANVVTYTDSGFSPSVLTVKLGSIVTFQNKASDAMRVASNPHPTHTGYPTRGGCVGSTFDACKDIGPGTSWTFKFDIAGTWGYHNHLDPKEGGTVVVEK